MKPTFFDETVKEKTLSRSSETLRLPQKPPVAISKLSHRNLVKLIGWCHKKGELLLVYEYFPTGSLDKLLYARARTTSSSLSMSMSASTDAPELTWERRYKIIRGVASALDYLHHGSSKRILHRDAFASWHIY